MKINSSKTKTTLFGSQRKVRNYELKLEIQGQYVEFVTNILFFNKVLIGRCILMK